MLTAINTALDAHSPAQSVVPICENLAAGIGESAAEYDFATHAEAIAAAVEDALETAFSGSEQGDPGQTIGEALSSDIGEGAFGYGFTTDAAVVAASVKSALGQTSRRSLRPASAVLTSRRMPLP